MHPHARVCGPLRGAAGQHPPSLLPAFTGLNTTSARLMRAANWPAPRCTASLPELDHGEILAQAAVPVLPDDARRRPGGSRADQEHLILPPRHRAAAYKINSASGNLAPGWGRFHSKMPGKQGC